MEINNLEDLQNFHRNENNLENYFYISPIPDLVKEYPCILGIDEAGRGPVLGPMVYGTAFIPINEQILLETLGCADSKSLTEEKRDVIFENICKQKSKIGWAVEVISPNYISNCMLSRCKYSLNQVSMDAAIKLIKEALTHKVRIAHVYVDTVGKPEKYQDYLKTIFPDLNITVAKKADSTYPIVSAASICAKVGRDHALKVWSFPEDIEIETFGSGYPADPVTKKFMTDYCDMVFGYPQLVRFSWSTASDMMDKLAYHVEYEEEEDAKSPPAQSTSITTFFKIRTKKGEIVRKENDFLKKRCLSRKVEF